MDEAEYCHRIALMYRGKVIALGSPAELKKTSGISLHPVELESSDLLETMSALDGVEGIGDVAVFGGGLHVTVADAASADSTHPRRSGSEIHRCHRLERIKPSMEDVFVAMIEAGRKESRMRLLAACAPLPARNCSTSCAIRAAWRWRSRCR